MPLSDHLTPSMITQNRSLGNIVKEFRVNGAIEFRAVPLAGDALPMVARCNDVEDDVRAYRAACLLAEAVRIDLEDGLTMDPLNYRSALNDRFAVN